jgi:hypothetical protein
MKDTACRAQVPANDAAAGRKSSAAILPLWTQAQWRCSVAQRPKAFGNFSRQELMKYVFALVLLSVPTWITWPFLGTERRTTVLEFVDRIVELTKALTTSG